MTAKMSLLAGMRPTLCRVVPAAACICLLGWCYVSLRPDFAWDDADPEVLNMAWRLARGEGMYRGTDTAPFAFAAYPPLYYALAAILLRATGLSFLPAKLLSFLAALSIGWALVRLDRHWNQTTQAGFRAAFLLFLIPAFLYNAARSNVQMLAVAFSVWSLVFFLRNRPLETLVLSPLLAVLAFYTKQTQIALPLAMGAYLLLRKRQWLLPYAATGLVAGLVPLFWLQKNTRGNFLYDTIQLARLDYNPLQIPQIFAHHAGPLILFIGIALLTSCRRFRGGVWEPVDLYLACVFLTTVASLGRLGAHGQYVLELLVVTVLYSIRTCKLPALRGREALISLQVLFLLVYTPLFVSVEEGKRGLACNRAAERIYPLIRTGSGPILSQQGSFALFARGEIYIQLFHFTALSRAGLWDQSLLLREIEKQSFSWVVTEFPLENPVLSPDDLERFTPEMVQALQNNYERRESVFPYYIYGPRHRGYTLREPRKGIETVE